MIGMPDVVHASLVTTGSAARELRVARETVRRWIVTGVLPAISASDGTMLIARDHLDDLIARRRAHETALGGEHVSA